MSNYQPHLPMNAENMKHEDVLGLGSFASSSLIDDDLRDVLLLTLLDGSEARFSEADKAAIDQNPRVVRRLKVAPRRFLSFEQKAELFYYYALSAFGPGLVFSSLASLMLDRVSELDKVCAGLTEWKIEQDGGVKRCEHCGRMLTPPVRTGKRFCGGRCRKANFDQLLKADRLMLDLPES